MKLPIPCFAAVALPLLGAVHDAAAQETRTERVQFKPGKSQAVISGKIVGRESVVYKLNAKDGQFLKVSLRPDNQSADYNIYIPGRGPGDEALFASATGGREYLGQLYKTGDHSISVFLNRAAARRGETANYDLVVDITDSAPGHAEEKSATGPLPQKVIDDCLKTLRKQIPDKSMKVLKAERGESSFIIDVRVDGVPKPWRCYHDGTKCTGTDYQGEG